MKVAFFTEMGFTGKVSRNHPNMRTEFAWMCALEADHYNINSNSINSYKKQNKGIYKSWKHAVISYNLMAII